MKTYDLYLLAHVAAVVAWVGAGFLMCLLGARIGLSGDTGRRLGYAQDSEWLGLRFFLPSSMLALVSGALLVHEGNWGYGPLWIRLGFAALVLSTILGVAVFGPGWKRVNGLVAGQGPGSAEVRARVAALLLFCWVDLGLLVAALFVMLIKPSGDDAVALVFTVLIPVATTAIGVYVRRRSLAPGGAAVAGPVAQPAGGAVGTGAGG